MLFAMTFYMIFLLVFLCLMAFIFAINDFLRFRYRHLERYAIYGQDNDPRMKLRYILARYFQSGGVDHRD